MSSNSTERTPTADRPDESAVDVLLDGEYLCRRDAGVDEVECEHHPYRGGTLVVTVGWSPAGEVRSVRAQHLGYKYWDVVADVDCPADPAASGARRFTPASDRYEFTVELQEVGP